MRTHGKRSTYIHGCHCADCTAANTTWMRERRRLQGMSRAMNRETVSDVIDELADLLHAS